MAKAKPGCIYKYKYDGYLYLISERTFTGDFVWTRLTSNHTDAVGESGIPGDDNIEIFDTKHLELILDLTELNDE